MSLDRRSRSVVGSSSLSFLEGLGPLVGRDGDTRGGGLGV
jgi:hypothetical protein